MSSLDSGSLFIYYYYFFFLVKEFVIFFTFLLKRFIRRRRSPVFRYNLTLSFKLTDSNSTDIIFLDKTLQRGWLNATDATVSLGENSPIAPKYEVSKWSAPHECLYSGPDVSWVCHIGTDTYNAMNCSR